MKINKIQFNPYFKSNQQQEPQKKELIDQLLDKVKNPKDVNDCVSVPRGIFKAYMCLMSGTAIGSIAGLLPKKAAFIKTPLNIVGSLLGLLSAAYFAKPFIVEGLTPTVSREQENQQDIQQETKEVQAEQTTLEVQSPLPTAKV